MGSILGEVYYNAVSTDHASHVFAVGWVTCADAVVQLEQDGDTNDFQLIVKPPNNPSADVITPFEAAARIHDDPRSIFIKDDYGRHHVQAKKIKPGEQSSNEAGTWVQSGGGKSIGQIQDLMKVEAKISSVQSVYFHINKSNPPQLVVVAMGEVNSSGWTNGRLTPWTYLTPPEDGIQDFDFLATTPSGIVLWSISCIEGKGVIELANWMKGVRIHASNNNMEVMFDDEPCSVELRTVSTMGIPQPS